MSSDDMGRSANEFDVLIIGAGISGINAAYRVQTSFPDYKYAILETRNAIGGTWDFFRYPGIRSDSDLHTFGFSWRPWSNSNDIADGSLIRAYIKESAEMFGIDQKVKFAHKLLAGDWSSKEQQWSLSVNANGEMQTFKSRFIIISTGYYDYNHALPVQIPEMDSFKGKLIHPQFWPEDLDYTNKKIVIIGSGATAITLLPALAEKAAFVTMLQRSPTYIMALPSSDPVGKWSRKFLPAWLANRLLRSKNLIFPFLFFKFCRAFPNFARYIIKKSTLSQLPPLMPHDPNFNPSYSPWDQRLCICPDGDFFLALRNGTADVLTDTVKRITATGIQTNGGKTLDADIIVTATGLKLQLVGGARLTVNGEAIPITEKFLWKGSMIQDIPNAVFVIGYTYTSWTLGADATAKLTCRLMNYMRKNSLSSAVPRTKDGNKMESVSVLSLSSTYVEKGKATLPKAGNQYPWRPRTNYFTDSWIAEWGTLATDLHFTEERSLRID